MTKYPFEPNKKWCPTEMIGHNIGDSFTFILRFLKNYFLFFLFFFFKPERKKMALVKK